MSQTQQQIILKMAQLLEDIKGIQPVVIETANELSRLLADLTKTIK